jgi:hypothetical protein
MRWLSRLYGGSLTDPFDQRGPLSPGAFLASTLLPLHVFALLRRTSADNRSVGDCVTASRPTRPRPTPQSRRRQFVGHAPRCKGLVHAGRSTTSVDRVLSDILTEIRPWYDLHRRPRFFEGLVFREIDQSLLQRCLLLCDRVGFRRALVEASALRFVGREYMAVCAPTPHSFHPKVWLLISEDEAALLVGSGNLAQSGFMTNQELFDAVRLGKGGPRRTAMGSLHRSR